MSKKIVELKSKKKIELKEMTLDEVDFCNDISVMKYDNGKISHLAVWHGLLNQKDIDLKYGKATNLESLIFTIRIVS